MTEISAQPQTPSKYLNWKNVLLGIGIGVLLLALVGSGILVYNTFISQPTPTPQVTVTPKKSASPSAKTSTTSAKPATSSAQTDETAGWKTYTENGISFKYPPTWTLGKVTRPSDNFTITEATSVTSPSGFYLYFVTNLDGLGGGCGPTDPNMLDVNAYSIKKAGFNNYKGEAVNIVEWGVSGGFLQEMGQNFVRKEVGLSDHSDFPKLGDNGKECLIYERELNGELMSSPLNPLISAFHGQYPDDSSFQKLTPTEYFSLPEVKTAEKI